MIFRFGLIIFSFFVVVAMFGQSKNYTGTLLFATDRPFLEGTEKIFGDTDPASAVTPEVLSGSVDVFFPLDTHKRGSLEYYGKYPERSFRITRHNHSNLTAQNICPTEQQKDSELLVFIHGYNTTFNEAVLKAAQFKADLPWSGPVLIISWHSAGRLMGYGSNLDASAEAAEQFASTWDVLRACWRGKINILAHSMGNKFFLESIQRLSTDKPLMKRLVFAAPDVSVIDFAIWAPKTPRLFEKVVHYYSHKDLAIKASEAKRFGDERNRAGNRPFAIPGIESISVDNVNSYADMGHGYFANSPAVLDDIHKLFTLPIEKLTSPLTRGSPIKNDYLKSEDLSYLVFYVTELVFSILSWIVL